LITTESGPAHIRLRHGAAFAAAGVPPEDAGVVAMAAATRGVPTELVVGHAQRVVEVAHRGRPIFVATAVSPNGYLIAAHPEPAARVADESGWIDRGGWRLIALTLMAEWDAGPLWPHFSRPDGARAVANYLPRQAAELLALPDNLVSDLTEWDAVYQSILDRQRPQESAFLNGADAGRFQVTGRRLASWLRSITSPDVLVQHAYNFSERTLTLA
jgi:hypothetical protein